MQDIQVEFGRRVRVARVERSWTQARLAERLHTTTRTVSKIERGQINISLDTIRAYACELDLSLVPWHIVRSSVSEHVLFVKTSTLASLKYVRPKIPSGSGA